MTMMLPLLLVLLATGATGQLEACGDAAGTVGYKTVAALNEAATADAGIFTICPDSVLSDEMLRPMVDGSVFQCASCVLTTGVVLDVDDIRVSIVGVTFSDFTDAVVSGSAGSTTTLELRQVVFQNFNSSMAVSQANVMRQPFRLEVTGAEVRNAFGGVLFSNAGAELSIEDLSVMDSTMMSVVSTANSRSSEGSSFLRRVLVAESSVDDVFLTMGSADVDAMGINVNNMRSVTKVFSVTDEGTGARIHDLVVADNALQSRWTVIDAMEESEVLAENISVFNSTSLRHVFSVAMRATFTLDKAEIADLAGGRIISPQDVSSIVFSNSESIVSVDRLDVDSVSMFTSVFFGNAGSTMTVMRSCVQAGSVQATVYASEETSVTSTDNYITSDFGSAVCGTGDERMVKENPGSGCFQEDRQDCAFECEPFFSGMSCRADETDSPTLSPTNSPTTVTAMPTTRSPTAVTALPTVGIRSLTSISPSLSGAPTNAANTTLMPTTGNTTLMPTTVNSSINGTVRVKPNRIDIYGDDTLIIEQSIDYDSQTVSVAVTSVVDGWIGFAFSDSPNMVSSDPMNPTAAIIGIPEDGTVRKYLIGGRSIDLVTPLPENRQSLTNTSITQKDDRTTLSFTKPLEELSETSVSLTGENGFIFAVGTTPDLSYHGAVRGFASAVIPVIGAPISMTPSALPSGVQSIPALSPVTPGPTMIPTSTPTKAPASSMPTPTAPFTSPPTVMPTRTPTKSPTEFLITRNPSHVPTSMLIEATLRPTAVGYDGTKNPASRPIPPSGARPTETQNPSQPIVPSHPRPITEPPKPQQPTVPSNPRPTHSPLSNRFTPTALPMPVHVPSGQMPINRHGDDDDDDSYHVDTADDDDDSGSCDCSEKSEKKGKGKGKSSSKSSEGKGEKKESSGKGKKSKHCKCKKGKKRHSHNHQVNYAVHRAGKERV